MKRVGYLLSLLTVAVILLAWGIPAKADPIDPKIVLGPTGSTIFPNQTDCIPNEVSTGCSLGLDANGNGTADVTNNLGAFIIQDTVTIVSSFTGVLTCQADPTTAPNWTGTASGNSCIFTGGFISPGNTYGLNFLGFTANSTLTFALTALTSTTPPTVPEPSTIGLLGIAFVAMAGLALRKRLGAAQHAG